MTRKKSSKQIANKGTNRAADSFANPELKQIEQLLQFMTEHNLEEFEYSRGDLRIRLRKPSSWGGAAAVAEWLCAGDNCSGRGDGDFGKPEFASLRGRRGRAKQRGFTSDQISHCRDVLWRAESGGGSFCEGWITGGDGADAVHRGSHEVDERD